MSNGEFELDLDSECPLGNARILPHLCHGMCQECIIESQGGDDIEEMLSKADIWVLQHRPVPPRKR
jgi:hypothetical protein